MNTYEISKGNATLIMNKHRNQLGESQTQYKTDELIDESTELITNTLGIHEESTEISLNT